MDPPWEVVVTGVGMASPIGIGRAAFWSALVAGKSGVGPITTFDASRLPVRFAGELKDFDPKQYVKPRKSLKVMCREIQTAFAAAALAAEDAGLPQLELARERVGVLFGSEMLYGDVEDFVDLYRHCMVEGQFDFDRFGQQFPSHMYPLWMLKNLPNMAACHIAIALDARGPNNTIVLGDASSLLAVMEGAEIIRRGMADVMVVGGTGSRLALTGWMYRGDIGLSHRNDDPPAASRPFDAQRDGMVVGEGAGALILERESFARQRGARVLARLGGFGSSVDVQRNGIEGRREAILRSLRQALTASRIEPDQIDHVNAHGLSMIEQDIAEAEAIQQTLGQIPVTALKSYFGNLGAGGGAVELAGAVLALQQGQVPPTLNYHDPDPRCPLNVVQDDPRPVQRPYLLKLSQSLGGQSVAVALARGDA